MLENVISFILNNELHVILIVGVLLLLAAEIGYRGARRHNQEQRKRKKGQASTLQGALLGLLGLLLGFTFAMAVSRFDTRKQLVLDESNAIGTAWLRAGFLPTNERIAARQRLSDYLDSRLAMARAVVGDEAFDKALARSEANQAGLWQEAAVLARDMPTPMVALYASAINDVIDLDAKRQVAIVNYVPASVWLLLLIVSVTVCWATGYTTGLGEGGRLALAMFVLPCLLAIVIAIVAALDRPNRGLIKVSQQSMEQLRVTLRKYNPDGSEKIPAQAPEPGIQPRSQ